VRWADALRASKVGKATRPLVDGDDTNVPSVILVDPKAGPNPKAFHVVGDQTYGWVRVPLKLAGKYDDWEPVDPREVVEELGKLAEDLP